MIEAQIERHEFIPVALPVAGFIAPGEDKIESSITIERVPVYTITEVGR